MVLIFEKEVASCRGTHHIPSIKQDDDDESQFQFIQAHYYLGAGGGQ